MSNLKKQSCLVFLMKSILISKIQSKYDKRGKVEVKYMLERGRRPGDEKRSISFLERFKYAASVSALYTDSKSLPQEDGFPWIVKVILNRISANL